MADPIGFQNGIEAARKHWKELWPNKAWPDKLADTLQTLVAGHNEGIVTPEPTPEPEPEPEPIPQNKYAPRTYNSTPSADARFCMKAEYGVKAVLGGFIDAMGVRYDESGRDLGGRTKNIVPELKGANSMDGREPCDPYTGPTGKAMPPYPLASFER